MRAVNLIPADARAGGRFGGLDNFSPVTLAVLGSLIAALVVVAAMVFINNKTNDRLSEADRINGQVSEVQLLADRLAPDLATIQARERSVAAARTLAGGRYDWARLLGTVSGSLPRNAKLTGFSGTIGSQPSSTPASSTTSTTAAPAGAGSVVLTGCARSLTTVARAMSRLRRVDGIEDVTFSGSTKGTSAPQARNCRRDFSLTLVLSGPSTSSPATAASTATTTPTGATG